MNPSGPNPRGLRPTLRHQMILVATFALAFALVDLARRRDASDGVEQGALLALIATPWILAGLVSVLDRPGPVRNWAVPSLLMLFPPALAIRHDWIVATEAARTGVVPNPAVTLLLNAFLIGSYVVYWHVMGPADCPGCGRRALIPLMRMWGQARRTEKTRWCAACGGLYWRRGGRAWHKERRTTWMDRAPEGDWDSGAGSLLLEAGLGEGAGDGSVAGGQSDAGGRTEGPHRPAGAPREGTVTA